MTKTVDEIMLLHKLVDSFVPFVGINSRMPARAVQTFWLVAGKEGLNVDEYAKRLGCSPTTMSRFLLDLGERDRKGDPGAKLVEGKPNVLDRREILYRLTAKGDALKAQILRRFQ